MINNLNLIQIDHLIQHLQDAHSFQVHIENLAKLIVSWVIKQASYLSTLK